MTNASGCLERYRGVVEDWERFWEANHAPEPIAFRIRRAIIHRARLIERLASSGFTVEPIGEVDGYFRVLAGAGSVAQTIEHWLGFLHIQQAVMGLPPLALGPRPGERVLDLCAAPGGKTSHISELMGEEGPLVALDPKEKRIRGLLANLYRLGCMNVVVVAGDGRQLPQGGLFDRVLVDAPCSGEGNYRRKKGRLPDRSAGFVSYVTRLQEDLLRTAIRVTRPGGVIVYSTCTYAPEENEAVLDRVRRDCPVEIEPIHLSAPHCQGLGSWKGQRFHAEVERAWRVYPHHLDSGGLFMARLRRLENSLDSSSEPSTPQGVEDAWSSIPSAFPGEDPGRALERIAVVKEELAHWFEFIPEIPRDLGLLVRGRHVWSHTARLWPIDYWSKQPHAGSRRVISVGLRAFRAGPGSFETPTSHFLTRWGGQLRDSRRFELDQRTLLRLLENGEVAAGSAARGPVAVSWEGMVLGRGVVGAGGLRHELGRPHAERLRALLT